MGKNSDCDHDSIGESHYTSEKYSNLYTSGGYVRNFVKKTHYFLVPLFELVDR